jgi:hypothetical protein
VNIEEIVGSIERHAAKQGMKLEETQADPELWVYELRTNSDLSVEAAVSDPPSRDVVRCGPGRDEVQTDPKDNVGKDGEKVQHIDLSKGPQPPREMPKYMPSSELPSPSEGG